MPTSKFEKEITVGIMSLLDDVFPSFNVTAIKSEINKGIGIK